MINVPNENQEREVDAAEAVIAETEVETAKAEAAATAQNIPRHVHRENTETIETMITMMGKMPGSHPFAGKVTEQHIDKVLDLEKQQMEYTYKIEQGNKKLFFGVFLVACIFLSGLIVFLTNNNKDVLLMDIIKVFLGFAAGFGAGISAKAFFKKE